MPSSEGIDRFGAAYKRTATVVECAWRQRPLISPSHRVIPFLAVGLVAALAAYGHLSAGIVDTTGPAPAPFDPLTDDEQQDAIHAALASPLVRLQLSDSYEVIGASLRTDKEDMRQAHPPRLADVQIYDYATDQVIWAVVDVRAGVVEEIVPLLLGYQPPLTANERERAAEMAWAHPDVIALVPQGEVLPSVHSWSDATLPPCNTHRCVSVAFYKEDLTWGFTFRAIVDLSAGRLIDVRALAPGEAH